MENKLVITIVLYQTEISQTPSYDYIKEIINKKNFVHLLVYDNSQKPQENELFYYDNVHYIHDETNPGLAKAYNIGIKYFNQIQGGLLLLLDQDSLLDSTYLDTLLTMSLEDEVVAYVPIVFSHGRQISPVFSDQYIGCRSELPKAGIYSQRLMSINSGAVLSKELLKSIGFFNEEFPLDFLDHWLFYEIHQLGKKICVLDYRMEHELSVLNYEKLSSQRYESIIRAETLFYQKYDRNKFHTHRRHLLLRTIKQFFLVKNRNIWRRTFIEYQALMKGK
ncbi:glycosyltransferase [Enterococcus ureasiticus]|uniref:Glycosyl transferase family 2 n=1 Tax=Enterococcus ureasiticus TaxID=903984 RepID=A0A1E5GFB5_9ENTE|nr:glycosyltransferase [Enterococcus ureasiticus]OEG11416.1 glycosyl transferase family 2 [Enterococcus ureasiticus]